MITSTVARNGIGAIIAILLLMVAGCTGGSRGPAGSGLVQADPGLTRIAPDQREPAPIAEGNDLDGAPLSAEQFAGKVVVLNVWGSWCPPCRKEAPDLVAAHDQTAEIAQFVGINTRDLDPAPAQAFVRAFKINYPSIFDPSGAELLKFADLPPGAIPSTLIIDSQGRVAARVIGQISAASLVALITDVSEGK